jgi:hypothetical protein
MSFSEHDPVPTAVLDGAVREYSRDKVYVLTALVLAAITVVEVLTYALPDFPLWDHDTNLIIVVLLLLMAVKFWIVAAIFMHLRFDKKILTVTFYSGLILAVGVYVAALCMFRIWWPGSHT